MKPNQLICGNNIDVVKPWPNNCIDGICTDPPYELGFMGKGWDSSGIAYSVPMWRQMLRITKPGGLLLCFGGTRTSHRLTCAIEDAGWQIRDCMMWLYGSGFPKSHDISKAIDKAAGAKRKVIGTRPVPGYAKSEVKHGKQNRNKYEFEQTSNIPASVLAWLWQGYGTALKPAWELIIVAMKPLDGTFAHNAEKHGVAGLNIDGGRIGKVVGDRTEYGVDGIKRKNSNNVYGKQSGTIQFDGTQGRWPANLILAHHPECTPKYPSDTSFYELDDEYHGPMKCHPNCPIKMLDEQSGITKSTGGKTKSKLGGNRVYGTYAGDKLGQNAGGLGDSGGASRYFKILEPEPCFLCGYIEEHGNLEVGPNVFLCDECSLQGEALDLPKRFLYCAKTSRKERNMGMENCEDKLLARSGGARSAEKQGKDEYLQQHIGLNRVAVVKNNHPTVKPLALMKYLCTLLKMPSADQIILDPFIGSGTTGMACAELGIGFIGIEKEPDYCEISAKRIGTVLGKTLPVTKNVETPRATIDSAGGKCRRPNESLPHVSESRQSIINAASAALHTRRNQK